MSPTVPTPVVKAQSLSCPNCGGTIQLRGFAHSLTAVCESCLTVLDTTTSPLSILHKAKTKERRTPKIPLGSRGKFGGTTHEVIGFQTRAITVDGAVYEWDEYVLFNPYKGFLYLTEYQGHWNLVYPVRSLPDFRAGTKPKAIYKGETYTHFQHAVARTEFVLGEFPWRVKVGEEVTTDDYTNPPKLLSSETTANEVTWSRGEYLSGDSIWQTFNLKDKPPAPTGIYVNQPNPNIGRPTEAWRLFVVFLACLFVLGFAFLFISRRERVLNERHHFYPAQPQAFVTSEFELKGRTSNVVVETKTDARNNWMFVGYALINAATGNAYNFGREISYYVDGSDTEGSRSDSATIPAVPPGRYYLLVDPEGDPKNQPIEFDIVVRRDVPSALLFALGALLLAIPPIAVAWKSYRFEYQRWQESDYSGGSSSSSGDDD